MLLRNLFKKAQIEQHNNQSQPSSEIELTVFESKPYPKLITEAKLKDVTSIVTQFLTTQDFANVSKVCRGSRALFAPSRSINKLQNLLQAVAYGDLKEAEKIINTDPTLLLKSGTVTDYSGRIHSNRTAFQLALGACDYHVKDEKHNIVVRGMVEKLEELFYKLPGKSKEQIREIMHDQYVEQFPEGHEAIEAKRVTEDSEALHRIINVITDLKDEKDCTAVSKLEDMIYEVIRKEKSERADKLNNLVQNLLKATSNELFEKAFDAFRGYLTDSKLLTSDAFNINLLKALYQFRWHLEPKGNQTTGKHFNHQLLAEAAQLYNQNYAQFGNLWDHPKNLFCWQKVFGRIERLVPACDAQSIAYGLWSLFSEGNESPRTLKFRKSGAKYYPLTLDPDWEIGHNCGHGGVSAVGSQPVGAAYAARLGFPILCRAKSIAPDHILQLGRAIEEGQRDKVIARR